MYRIEFKLRQHTPIIHFQAQYTDATLRASEVKPKLDKYLKKKYSDKFNDDSKEKLEYKIRFIAEDVVVEDITKKNAPMFFGNMNNAKPKRLVMAKGGVKMTIILKDKYLKDIIQECIQDFFLSHNFGARQSKGYGSFTVDENSTVLFDQAMELYEYLAFKIRTNDAKIALEAIGYFYKSLRSGLNEYRNNAQIFYLKPAIHYYASKKGLQWDKKSIKDFASDGNKQLKENRVLYDFRDMFGLSSQENWRYHNIKIKKKCFAKKNVVVDRIKSPVFFKPIFLPEDNDSDKDTFLIFFGVFPDNVGLQEVVKTEVNICKNRCNIGSLFLKFNKDFDLMKALGYVFKNRDVEREMVFDESHKDGKRIKGIILDIYRQLKDLYQ